MKFHSITFILLIFMSLSGKAFGQAVCASQFTQESPMLSHVYETFEDIPMQATDSWRRIYNDLLLERSISEEGFTRIFLKTLIEYSYSLRPTQRKLMINWLLPLERMDILESLPEDKVLPDFKMYDASEAFELVSRFKIQIDSKVITAIGSSGPSLIYVNRSKRSAPPMVRTRGDHVADVAVEDWHFLEVFSVSPDVYKRTESVEHVFEDTVKIDVPNRLYAGSLKRKQNFNWGLLDAFVRDNSHASIKSLYFSKDLELELLSRGIKTIGELRSVLKTDYVSILGKARNKKFLYATGYNKNNFIVRVDPKLKISDLQLSLSIEQTLHSQGIDYVADLVGTKYKFLKETPGLSKYDLDQILSALARFDLLPKRPSLDYDRY